MRKAINSTKRPGDNMFARTEPKPTKKKVGDQGSTGSKKSKA